MSVEGSGVGEAVERKPIVEIDLKDNGGVIAPYTAEEFRAWAQAEIDFWSWVTQTGAGNHRQPIDEAITQLGSARDNIREFANRPDQTEYLNRAVAHIKTALVDWKLPHSSSALAKEVETLRAETPTGAIAFLLPQLVNTSGYAFQSNLTSDWHKYVLGLFRRYGEPTGSLQLESQREAFEAFSVASHDLVAAHRRDFDKLHNDLSAAIKVSTDDTSTRTEDFTSFMKKSAEEYGKLVKGHQDTMAEIERKFGEKMALRAPVRYWTSREVHHRRLASKFTCWSFGSIGALAVAIGLATWWAVAQSPDSTKPDQWRLALAVLLGVLGIWAVRLVVRMFHSHTHLANDAAERVTMAQTYLSLLEGEKMPPDEDRKLILAALFRPSSDGMVKDEGVPHVLFEQLMRPR